MIRNQLSVFLENRIGCLNEITGILADNGINLEALTIAETTDYGVLRIIVEDEEKAVRVLKENNYIVSLCPVLMIEVSNKPGGLHSVLQKISAADIDVRYMYSIHGEKNGAAYMIFRVDCPEELERVLNK